LNRWPLLAFYSVVELIEKAVIPSLDLATIFGRSAPLQVDLGCVDGSFLLQMSQLHPEKNFLGIERLAKRATKTARKSAELANMRVLRIETSHALELLQAESVETFYLLFPDPWPKRRHHRRRLVTTSFLASIHRALEPDGIFRIATDHRNYFDQIEKVARAVVTNLNFKFLPTNDWQLPPTKFEVKFRRQGLPIYRLSLRKTSPVT